MKRRGWTGRVLVGLWAFLVWGSGAGWGHELLAQVEWSDSPPPPTVRIAFLSLGSGRPLFEQRSVLDRPLQFRLSQVVQGLYLLVVEVTPEGPPLVRWVRVKAGEGDVVRVQVRLDRTLLESLRRQASDYRGAMQMLHRPPLHEAEVEPLLAGWDGFRPTRPVNVEVGYWMTIIPQAWNTGAVIHTAQWQWRWGRGASRVRGYLAGQWIRGQWDRWRGLGEMEWTVVHEQTLHLQALYERMEPVGVAPRGGIHHGWLSLETRWHRGERWTLQLEGRGRSLDGPALDTHWSYWSEVRVDYADTPYTRLFLRGGVGRVMAMDLIPAHAVRQAYWVERLLSTAADFPEGVAFQRWGGLGLQMGTESHALGLQVLWREDDWRFYRGRRRMEGPGLELNSRVRLPVGRLTVDYELTRRTWGSGGFDRFWTGWCRYLVVAYDVDREPLGQLSVRYQFLRGPVVPWVVLPATSRSLDVEWVRAWVPAGGRAQMQFRVVVLNLLNQYTDLSIGLPGEYFWFQMPRTWVWSVTTRW